MRKHAPWILFCVLTALIAGFVTSQPWIPQVQAQGKKKKKLSLRQMKKKMNGWAREIGVKCKYCHIKEGEEFDYEAETPKKKIAAHCDEHFVQKLQLKNKRPVSCQTCHMRKTRFLPREDGGDGGDGGDDSGK